MKSHVSDNSVPICADVTKFDFDLLAQKQLAHILSSVVIKPYTNISMA